MMNNSDILYQTELYLIRLLSKEDKNDYIQYQKKMTGIANLLDESSINLWWEKEYSDDSHMLIVILEKNSELMCGLISMNHMNTQYIEVGIGILEEYQNHGISTLVFPKILEIMKNKFPDKSFYARIQNDNLPSIALMNKIGANLVKTEATDFVKMLRDINNTYPEVIIDDILKENESFLKEEKSKYVQIYHL